MDMRTPRRMACLDTAKPMQCQLQCQLIPGLATRMRMKDIILSMKEPLAMKLAATTKIPTLILAVLRNLSSMPATMKQPGGATTMEVATQLPLAIALVMKKPLVMKIALAMKHSPLQHQLKHQPLILRQPDGDDTNLSSN